MTLSWTLSYYIGRQFLLAVCIALFGFIALGCLIDVIELLRRASGQQSVPFSVIIGLALLNLPALTLKFVPYAVLVGTMLALTRLTRTQELVVARAAGVSVWQFMAPVMAVALGFGIFMVAVFGPFASILLMRHEQMEAKYLSGRVSLLSISDSGLWLRQIEEQEEHIIYARAVSPSDMSFSGVIVFSFDKDKRFSERMDAKRAVLGTGHITLQAVTRSLPGKPSEKLAGVALPTSLTMGTIQDSFASPETLSLWQLPGFISLLEESGFSALKHRLYLHTMLATPFLLMGTVLLAAVFSLRQPRRGKIGILIVAGMIAGFLMNFFTRIISALGESGTLPVAVAAWAPAGVVIMVGAALLLHLEDG